MYWCFALINKRLAEIFFEEKNGEISMEGHCYVKASEYTTKTEKRQIKQDTVKHRFTYQNGRYKDQNGKTLKKAR